MAGFDGDKFPDLAVANEDSNDISILLNKPLDYLYPYPDTATVAVGKPFDFYVLALDAAWNLVTQYTGQIWFWTTDPQATIPEYYRFQPSDQGIASFPGGVTLRTPGQQVVYVFDTSTFQVIGYAVYEVVGAGPGRAGGGAGDAADNGSLAASILFNGQEQPRRHDETVRPLVATAVPVAEPRPTEARLLPWERTVPHLLTAGPNPAARLDRFGMVPLAVLDHLLAQLETQ